MNDTTAIHDAKIAQVMVTGVTDSVQEADRALDESFGNVDRAIFLLDGKVSSAESNEQDNFATNQDPCPSKQTDDTDNGNEKPSRKHQHRLFCCLTTVLTLF